MNKPKTLLEMEPKIAVVEDDLSLSNLLKRVLSQEGFSVKEFFTAESLISAVVDYKGNFDLIIMDIMLPGVNGREACKFLREKGVEIPILMLTALSTEDDKVNSFESGADDYLTKPFSIRELIARVKALLRRKGFSPFPKTEIETYNLTKKEREILELLLRNRGRTVSKDEIIIKIWKGKAVSKRAIDVHIKHIRDKTGMKIETVWGIGYKIP